MRRSEVQPELSLCNKPEQLNFNCMGLKKELGFQGDTAKNRAAVLALPTYLMK